MIKLSKHNKRVLGIVVLFIAIFVLGVSVMIIKEKRERNFWGKYEAAKSYIKKKPTISEIKRRTIFNALVKLQDKYSTLYPYDQDKQQAAYKEIAKRYYIIEATVRNIAIEGAKKGWIYDIDK